MNFFLLFFHQHRFFVWFPPFVCVDAAAYSYFTCFNRVRMRRSWDLFIALVPDPNEYFLYQGIRTLCYQVRIQTWSSRPRDLRIGLQLRSMHMRSDREKSLMHALYLNPLFERVPYMLSSIKFVSIYTPLTTAEKLFPIEQQTKHNKIMVSQQKKLKNGTPAQRTRPSEEKQLGGETKRKIEKRA